LIDPALGQVIEDLRQARNLAAHADSYEVDQTSVVDYVKLAGRVRAALRLAREAQVAAQEGRTAYDLLVYHDLSDPTPSSGGTIPEVGEEAEARFGLLGHDLHVVAVGPGIHPGRVTVVLAHGNRPMEAMQDLLDRQPD
jgi:hypothetical protein